MQPQFSWHFSFSVKQYKNVAVNTKGDVLVSTNHGWQIDLWGRCDTEQKCPGTETMHILHILTSFLNFIELGLLQNFGLKTSTQILGYHSLQALWWSKVMCRHALGRDYVIVWQYTQFNKKCSFSEAAQMSVKPTKVPSDEAHWLGQSSKAL